MSQFESCEKISTCSIAFENLGRNINNSMVCPNLEMCIGTFKPSDEAGLVLYNAVTSCYYMDPECNVIPEP